MAVRRAAFSGILNLTGRNLKAYSPFATGGTITDLGGYRIHTYTTVGNSTFQILGNLTSVEYLVVAGGGGGGGMSQSSSCAGGGGAGGMRTGGITVNPSTYAVTVGGAGSGGATSSKGGYGGDSVFGSITSTGGGGGGSSNSSGNSGGSGGGGGNLSSQAGGTGIAGQGNNGGNGSGGYLDAGTGGGAGSAGAALFVSSPSLYSLGLTSSISGTSNTYSFAITTVNGPTYSYTSPSNLGVGAYPTGTGGGALVGLPGGSGIVIIRYPIG